VVHQDYAEKHPQIVAGSAFPDAWAQQCTTLPEAARRNS
jgi:hypothetical protein